MTPSDLTRFLKEKMPEAEKIQVTGEQCDLTITIVSNLFHDKTAMKRQQLVYTYLTDLITQGAMHAVSMKLYTLDEWSQQEA